jgi:hypothetical protein
MEHMPRRRPGAALMTLLVSSAIVIGVLFGALGSAFASTGLKISLSLSPTGGSSTVVMTAVVAPASTKGTVSFVVDGHTVHRVAHDTTGAETFTMTGLTVGKHHLRAVFDPTLRGLHTVKSHPLKYLVTAVPPPPPPPPGADLQTIEVTVPQHPVSHRAAVLGIVKHRSPSGSKPGRVLGGVLGGVLPFTGADVWILLIIAVALLLVGVVIMRAGRKAALVTGTGAVLGTTAVLWFVVGTGASGTSGPTTSVNPARPAAGSGGVVWPGAEPDITVHDAAGKALQVNEPVKSGELVRIDATGFLPLEDVAIGEQQIRATSSGAVSYSFLATASTDIELRGSDLTSVWHLNTVAP